MSAEQERIRLLQDEERKHLGEVVSVPGRERQTIHHTRLPEPVPGSPIACEWNHYRQIVGQLLADGHEGRWVLIKGQEVIGIYDTLNQADQVRLDRYSLQPILVKQVLTAEPVLLGGGYHRQWRN